MPVNRSCLPAGGWEFTSGEGERELLIRCYLGEMIRSFMRRVAWGEELSATGGWRGRRGTRYITDPVTASSWAEPGLAQRRSSLRVRVHVSYWTLWSAVRERGETESPWPTRGSASCQDASSHSQLGNMCVDPKPRALEGDHTPNLSALAHLLFSNRLELMMR